VTLLKAVVIRSFGEPDVLQVDQVAKPEPADGEVRIKVEATSVNPIDIRTRRGNSELTKADLPMILGWDIAGSIDALGGGVTGFQIGDPILAMKIQLRERIGSYAEFTVVDANAVARRPATLDVQDAATLPLAGLTALQGLDLLDLHPGELVFINGAVGAVGGFATELAAACGARVVAAVREVDFDEAMALGAAFVVDREGDVAAQVHAIASGGVDAAFDLVGNEPAHVALAAVRDAGRFVTAKNRDVTPNSPDNRHSVRSIEMAVIDVSANAPQLSELAQAMDDGSLTPRVVARFDFTRASEAHRLHETGRLRAKVVLTPEPSWR
jgi:NADPH:quinone reductase-like Zn-dependent oxidoreductase